MNNLLDQFALSHTQVTRLHAELAGNVPREGAFSAKVELKLTPQEAATASDGEGLPVYQVSARLVCHGYLNGREEETPLFTVELILQAAYRQIAGTPMGFETFSQHHTSLTRQLYPLIHHQLQPILKQFGLDQVRLPYDLVNTQEPGPDQRQVH